MRRGAECGAVVRAAVLWALLLPAAAVAEPPNMPMPAAPVGADTLATRPRPRLPEPADPLEQWSLDPVPAQTGTGIVPAVPVPVVPGAPEPSTVPAPAPESAGVSPETASGDAEQVLVVHCRQILVNDPHRAAALERMLRAGVPLEKAAKSLGIVDLVQSSRRYVIDELSPEVRAEIESVPDSTWSRARPWRGRYAFYQVLGREQRPRSAVPKLGEGLDAGERSRLASGLQRLPQPTASQPPAPDADFQPAVVEQQELAEYPAAATGSGEVTLVVDVGRTGAPLGVRVEASTDPIFEGPAIEAARRSRYRAAVRSGTTEPGTVRLTYKFTAPQNP